MAERPWPFSSRAQIADKRFTPPFMYGVAFHPFLPAQLLKCSCFSLCRWISPHAYSDTSAGISPPETSMPHRICTQPILRVVSGDILYHCSVNLRAHGNLFEYLASYRDFSHRSVHQVAYVDGLAPPRLTPALHTAEMPSSASGKYVTYAVADRFGMPARKH